MAGNRHEHHHRKHRETGGRNDAEADLREKPEARTNAKKIDAEAEERKHGGRAKHPKGCACKKCMGGKAERKEGGKVHGEHAKHRADRKPRKSGGRTGADSHPFSSARHGTDPKDHKTQMEFE